jgi:hypothetical protein
MDTVVKDGFHNVSDMCTGPYAADCAQEGIK